MLMQIQGSFCSHLFPDSRVLFLNSSGGSSASSLVLARLKLGGAMKRGRRLPNAVICDSTSGRLVLVDIAKSNGPIDSRRRVELARLFGSHNKPIIFVTAFRDVSEFAQYQQVLSWGTSAWMATAPEHLVVFDGKRLADPYPRRGQSGTVL